MTNTPESFRDKWTRNPRLAFEETLREDSEIHRWILGRNGFGGARDLEVYLQSRRRVLDAGCGNGRVTALLRERSSPDTTEIVAADLVSAEVARENLAGYKGIHVSRCDITGDLSELGLFDFIYCQEVLHHTPDPRLTLQNLSGRLERGGDIAIYVYRRKAPLREFADDFIRERIGHLPYQEAMVACNQITELGKALAELNVKVRIPPVDLLEIQAGDYDVQRLVYHFFMKCFWNPALAFRDNAAINYDWYHPQLCSRHTLEEVREWFECAGLVITREFIDFYGITMWGRRV